MRRVDYAMYHGRRRSGVELYAPERDANSRERLALSGEAAPANYTAIGDCFNPGANRNNPIESHETTFSPESTTTVASTRNGQLRVPAGS